MIYIPDELLARLADWQMIACPVTDLIRAERDGRATLVHLAAALEYLRQRAERPYMKNDGKDAEWLPGLDPAAIRNVLADIREELTSIYITESAKAIERLLEAVKLLNALERDGEG